jgi:hypothetical protein
MVKGLDVFQTHFADHSDQFILIGGTTAAACRSGAGASRWGIQPGRLAGGGPLAVGCSQYKAGYTSYPPRPFYHHAQPHA